MRFKFFVVALLIFSLNVQAQPRRSRRSAPRTITDATARVLSQTPASTRGAQDAPEEFGRGNNRGATAAAGQTLPIRRVILYSNGVAYIERRGTVSGRAEVNLSFKQSQVDDVLKSMIVLDL